MRLMVEVGAVVLAHAIGAWLVTYLLHSTVMILFAHVVERVQSEPELRALVWRTALFGPVVTAGVHTAVPFGSPLRLSSEPAGEVLGPRPWLSLLIVAAWCALMTLRMWVVIRSEVRARAALGPRRPATDPRLLSMVAARSRAAGLRRSLRLTTSQRTFSPAAIAPAEVCVPQGTFDELSDAEQNALLAHEIAHHARRDPLWCGAATALAALCFFQPLNRRAVRQLKRASEEAADARAIRDTGDPLGLARALAALAPHALRNTRSRMAATGSPMVERIRRILDDNAARPRRFTRCLAAACVLTIIGVCLAIGPGVNFTPDRAANSIPYLTPSRAEPTPQMLELRHFDRRVRAVQRTVARRAAAALPF